MLYPSHLQEKVYDDLGSLRIYDDWTIVQHLFTDYAIEEFDNVVERKHLKYIANTNQKYFEIVLNNHVWNSVKLDYTYRIVDDKGIHLPKLQKLDFSSTQA